ncbi:MAG TPA: hypothetical protein VF681_14075 [Abditibacteriaceae bacterium]
MQTAHAQPGAQAEVAPQPENTRRAARHANRQKAGDNLQATAAKRDQKIINDFEAMFGRKLTEAQKTQLLKAASERAAAVKAAQENYNKEFLEITGVTEKELRQKRREMRQKEKGANADGANGEAANARRQRRQGKKTHPGNLPDGTPADAPQPAGATMLND